MDMDGYSLVVSDDLSPISKSFQNSFCYDLEPQLGAF